MTRTRRGQRHTITGALRRRLSPTTCRRLARVLFRAGGWLSRIKIPQRHHRIVSMDPDREPFMETEPSGWHWTSNPWSMRLLGASMQLDWDHWDHWATYCDHDHHSPVRCPDCGGVSCPDDDQPDDEESTA